MKPDVLAQYGGNQANSWGVPQTFGSRAPTIAEQLGVDPASEQAAAISDLAAAIRELADVLYHINSED